MTVLLYSCFHISLPRGVVKFVGELGTKLRTSQLRCQVRDVIGNLETKFVLAEGRVLTM